MKRGGPWPASAPPLPCSAGRARSTGVPIAPASRSRGAVRAVLQVEKLDANGSVRINDLTVTAAPEPAAGLWTPYQVEDDKTGWHPVSPSPTIVAGSALDASGLLDAPAGKHGFVTVREGRLCWTDGGRARFFGVSLLPPAAFQEPERADALADRLARSGINLVRLGDLDVPLGPDRSLFDDSRDDTKAFDPLALAKLDHLIAALKAGASIALEIQAPASSGPRMGWTIRAGSRRGAGRRRRSTPRSSGSRGRPHAPCSRTSTPRRAWRSATTRSWPG